MAVKRGANNKMHVICKRYICHDEKHKQKNVDHQQEISVCALKYDHFFLLHWFLRFASNQLADVNSMPLNWAQSSPSPLKESNCCTAHQVGAMCWGIEHGLFFSLAHQKP